MPGTVGPLWKNGAAPRSANSGGRLPLRSDQRRREGRAMMPDPNSPTSPTPGTPADKGLVYAAAVRLLAADRLAQLTGKQTAREQCVALAGRYGMTGRDIGIMLTLDERASQRALLTGQVPA